MTSQPPDPGPPAGPPNLDALEIVFNEALSVTPPERSRLLDERVGAHTAVRAQIAEMLRLHDAASSAFPTGGSDDPTAPTPQRPSPSLLDRTLGEFRILRAIGSGGMGAVYEARQAHPNRRVAVKVLNPWLVDPAHLRRFEFEAEILGSLEHPGIARIYGSGVAELDCAKTPYFAMEFIEGPTLMDYAAGATLEPTARVELLARLCDAVDYAHRKGVVHRDLKPGNILVTSDTGETRSGVGPGSPQPKVLDFGIAKVVGSAPSGPSQTLTGQVVGTLSYMSPEQARGDIHLIDARTDVYALGIIAYELLAGQPPYKVPPGSLATAAQVIEHTRPRLLGTIDRRLRGDIETIIAKALEKEPSRRYDSAGDLGADLRRHLASQPISAVPASAAYLVSRFARRHRALVAAAAVALASLLIGLVMALLGLREAWVQRDAARSAQGRTQTALEESAATVQFLADMLAAVQPGTGNREVTVRQVLDQSAEKVASGFADRPDAQARLRETIGNSYRALGLGDASEAQLAQAYRIRLETRGADDPATLRTRASQAAAMRLQGKSADAEPIAKEVLAAQRRRLGDDHRDTLFTANMLGVLQFELGRPAEAEKHLRAWLPVRERFSGPDARETIAMRNNLGRALDQQGKTPEAHAIYKANHEAALRTQGEQGDQTLVAINALAITTQRLGDAPEAEKLFRKARELRSQVLGPDHFETFYSWQGVAYCLTLQKKFGEAITEFQGLLEARRRSLGPAHPQTLLSMQLVGFALGQAGRWEDAEAANRQTYDARAAALGPEHADTALSLCMIAEAEQKLGKLEEAAETARRAHELRARLLGPGHPDTLYADALATECLLAQHLYEPAIGRLLTRWEVLKAPGTAPTPTGADQLATAEHLRDAYAARAGESRQEEHAAESRRWAKTGEDLRRPKTSH